MVTNVVLTFGIEAFNGSFNEKLTVNILTHLQRVGILHFYFYKNVKCNPPQKKKNAQERNSKLSHFTALLVVV